MSKKKNKFKKSKKHQILEATPTESVRLENPSPEVISEPAVSTTAPKAESTDHYETDKYDYVRKDIKKILVTMLVIILLLIGTYVLSQKTTVENSVGDWIYRILNIQTS